MAGICGCELRWRRDRRHAVPRHHGHDQSSLRARCEQPGHPREHGGVVAEDASQQRRPRKVDGERPRQAVPRSRRVLGGRHHEQRVRHPTARRSARGLGHRGGVGVDADDERIGALGRCGQHLAAIAGSQVERYPVVGGRKALDVAVVDLVDAAPSNYTEHVLNPRRKKGCGPARAPLRSHRTAVAQAARRTRPTPRRFRPTSAPARASPRGSARRRCCARRALRARAPLG